MFPIAWITLRRITEKAVLAQFAVLALVLVYVGLGLESVVMMDTAGSESSGLTVVWLFLTVFTVFWSTIEIPRELSRKEVHVYLSKPVSRLRYLLGKYLGMTAMVLAGQVVLLGIFAACLLLKGRTPSVAFAYGAVRIALFLSLLNAMCAAASLVLPEVPAMVAVLTVLAAAAVACVLAVLAWCAYDPGRAAALAAAYHAVPDLMHYRWESAAAATGAYVGALALYTAGWSVVMLLAAWALFARRDLA